MGVTQLETPVSLDRPRLQTEDDDSDGSTTASPSSPGRQFVPLGTRDPVTPTRASREEGPQHSPPLNRKRDPKPGLSPNATPRPLPLTGSTVFPVHVSSPSFTLHPFSLDRGPRPLAPFGRPDDAGRDESPRPSRALLTQPPLGRASRPSTLVQDADGYISILAPSPVIPVSHPFSTLAVPLTRPSTPPRVADPLHASQAAPTPFNPPPRTTSPVPALPHTEPTNLHLPPSMPDQAPDSTPRHDDVRSAMAQLAKLPDFDDEGKPVREAEWRYKFLVATRTLSDADKAQMWADKLVYEGEAHEWLCTLQNSSEPDKNEATKDWSKLLPLIEKRWPTPKRDPDAYAEHLRQRWDSSVFSPADMAADWADEACMNRPQEVWARQHLTKGNACGSAGRDLVYQTTHHALPSWVVSLLPKKRRYGTDFEQLCQDIGELTSRELHEAYTRERTMELLVAAQNLSLNDPRPTTRTPLIRRQPPKAVAETTPPTMLPARPAQVTFAQPLQSALKPRDAPPHLGESATQSQARLTATFPKLVAPDTPEERARHKALVTAWKTDPNNSGQKPSMTRPYPLSPGTYEQTRDICVKCGRAKHRVMECEDPSKWLREEERLMRGAIVRSLSQPRGSFRPAPASATVVRDTNQLEEEEDPYTDYYDESENEGGW